MTDRGAGPGGPTAFQIHGSVYHTTGPLDPRPGQNPLFAQLYLYDPHAAADFRFLSNSGLDPTLLTALSEFLHANNPLASIYRSARDRLHDLSVQTNRIILSPQMRLVVDVNADLRRENLPTGDEIALLIPGEYGQSSFRDIVLADRNGPGYSTISPTHPAYLPLAYPLILPFGTCPWFFPYRIRHLYRLSPPLSPFPPLA